MKANLFFSLVGLCLATLVQPPLTHGTDLYEYKPGETIVIDHGLAPDGRFAIAAGSLLKGSERQFGLFLIDGKSRHRIGPLEEFGNALDSGAQSIHAAWAPDSRHVAVTYRVDRSVTEMLVYRIENRRAYIVTGPLDLMTEVKAANAVDTSTCTTFYLKPKWLTASRFKLHQHSQYHRVSPNPATALGKFIEVEDEGENTAEGTGGKRVYSFDFYADAVCELTAGDTYRVQSVKPTPKAGR